MTRRAPSPGNRKHPTTGGQHLLDVKVRAVTVRRQRRQKIGAVFWMSALVVLIGVAAWMGISIGLDKFFFANPEYTLCRITWELDGLLTREDAIEVTGLREGENIFRADLGSVEQALRAIPMVADVTIDRELPDHLAITLTARRPIAWVAPSSPDADPFDAAQSLLVDRDGLLMKPRLIQPEFYHLPMIYGVRSDNIRNGEPLHNEDLHRALSLLDEVTRRPECLLNIRTMDISKGYCILVTNDKNARITFSSQDYPEQLGRLSQLLAHCRDTGRELESVNLMVRRNTPVTFVMAAPVTEKIAPSQKRTVDRGGKKN